MLKYTTNSVPALGTEIVNVSGNTIRYVGGPDAVSLNFQAFYPDTDGWRDYDFVLRLGESITLPRGLRFETLRVVNLHPATAQRFKLQIGSSNVESNGEAKHGHGLYSEFSFFNAKPFVSSAHVGYGLLNPSGSNRVIEVLGLETVSASSSQSYFVTRATGAASTRHTLASQLIAGNYTDGRRHAHDQALGLSVGQIWEFATAPGFPPIQNTYDFALYNNIGVGSGVLHFRRDFRDSPIILEPNKAIEFYATIQQVARGGFRWRERSY